MPMASSSRSKLTNVKRKTWWLISMEKFTCEVGLEFNWNKSVARWLGHTYKPNLVDTI